MVSYLSRLKQLHGDENFTHSPKPVPPKLTKGGFGGFVSTDQGAYANISADDSPLKVGAGDTASAIEQPFFNGEKTVPPTEYPVITGVEPAAAIPAKTGKEQEVATVFTAGKQRFDPEAWEERAAICEFDGGLSRDDAEAIAWLEDDRRRCCHCLNLLPNGVCKVASPKGPVVANRGYRPVDILKRCESYRPCPDDPDRRNGLERWPSLTDTKVGE